MLQMVYKVAKKIIELVSYVTYISNLKLLQKSSKKISGLLSSRIPETDTNENIISWNPHGPIELDIPMEISLYANID